jgi:hypothetical protein
MRWFCFTLTDQRKFKQRRGDEWKCSPNNGIEVVLNQLVGKKYGEIPGFE